MDAKEYPYGQRNFATNFLKLDLWKRENSMLLTKESPQGGTISPTLCNMYWTIRKIIEE